MTDKTNIIKILYKTKLELKSALHIGCAQKSPVGSFEMMKNGAGEYFIPGTSIAGVFIDTLRDLIDFNHKNNKKLFYSISDTEEINGEKKSRGSALVFRSINLGKNPPKQIRNRTKIDRETKTADDGALFSYWEIEPEKVNFKVKVEIDNLSVINKDEDIETLQKWVKLVFASWHKEGVFFGGHNTSGNGYCKLANLEESIINPENFNDYLDNTNNFNPVNLDNINPELRFKTWTITVDMNDEDDDYGTNALLIKGGVSHISLAGNPSDGVFINTGKRLFIPGSSLKGTFSMFLEKYVHAEDWLKNFFGQEGSKYQGYIYFPDLIFSEEMNNGKKHLINIERHAEDEFTRAVFGSGKFNEERLFYAKAEGKIRIPIKFYNDNKEKLIEVKNFLIKGCINRLISLGANGCYPKFEIEGNIIEEQNNEKQ
ncbi:MAG: hypothetical protein JXC36_07985 [Candidatus Atribacteria bacterium]|nr:hypothetical protein [Candidatus Atribacteria bacterium]